jgi:hypothetical protein
MDNGDDADNYDAGDLSAAFVVATKTSAGWIYIYHNYDYDEDYTYEFEHPNVVRISPYPFNNLQFCTVEYERMSADDFREIPNDLHRYFLDLALADIMINIGRIRKRYGGGNLRTPFGEIPLESDIFDEGKTLRSEVIEKLERLYVPNIRIEHG